MTKKNEHHPGPEVPRGDAGKWLPGQSPNPGGRRAYPEWFRGKLTDDALEHLAKVARGTETDERISRAQACIEVINRIIGKPKEHIEIESNGVDELVRRILTGGDKIELPPAPKKEPKK